MTVSIDEATRSIYTTRMYEIGLPRMSGSTIDEEVEISKVTTIIIVETIRDSISETDTTTGRSSTTEVVETNSDGTTIGMVDTRVMVESGRDVMQKI